MSFHLSTSPNLFQSFLFLLFLFVGCTSPNSMCKRPAGPLITENPYPGLMEKSNRILTTAQEIIGKGTKPITLSLISNKTPYAYVCKTGELVISTGLIDRLSNSQEIMFVLAHELSHLVLEHNFSPRARDLKQEQEADNLAYDLIKELGINPKVASKALLKFDSLENSTRYVRLFLRPD